MRISREENLNKERLTMLNSAERSHSLMNEGGAINPAIRYY